MGFYLKFAISNIRKNSQMIIPFMCTIILTVAMFYNVINIYYSDKTGSGRLGGMMMITSVLVALFSIVFLFYTNTFLAKTRKKEFGLYNILGLDKKHRPALNSDWMMHIDPLISTSNAGLHCISLKGLYKICPELTFH
ncbi:MAG: hypothetical protein ATN34_02300 [Epulopiscium sp. Nele67-Bin002]|nr:MAG: hypothetical protein ATN34_02300 [Epulopiscium sp. Nele67-Bin002]